MASKETERVKRWQKANPEKYLASVKRRWQNGKAKRADQRANRAFRFRSMKQAENTEGLATLTRDQLNRPRFRYIDPQGNVHVEYWQTPEELAEELRK